jgi:anthranilate 1,2-dioxygenase (deaminating, decarboxylating) small subunit
VDVALLDNADTMRGKSAASTPMPRTLHQITNVRIENEAEGGYQVKANWVTFYSRHGVAEHFFGHVTYDLRRDGSSWKVRRKHVLLLNDTINSVLDFYHL